MTVEEGWRGRCFEDVKVGDVYEHPLGRTVTTIDNAPIHFDRHYSSQTEFGKPLVDSTFTLALVTGQSVTDVSHKDFANLGWMKSASLHPSSGTTQSTPSLRSWRSESTGCGRT